MVIAKKNLGTRAKGTLMESILNSKIVSPGKMTLRVQKDIMSGMVIGALLGYLVLHPIIHIISLFHLFSGHPLPENFYQEVFKAFSVPMLPWSLAFMVLSGFIGMFLGKIRKADKEKSKIILELHNALDEVKTLSGFLPICASCKKIRDDKGYWNQIEAYISEHSEAEFSHGICPECSKKLYPEIYDDK
jgi:F0F1-type ATP synthase assembly protein I